MAASMAVLTAAFFEAAMRSLLLAVAVWAGLGALRVRNVIAQKWAWAAVLAGAFLMPAILPFAVRWKPFPAVTLALPAAWLGQATSASVAQKPVAQQSLALSHAAPALVRRVTLQRPFRSRQAARQGRTPQCIRTPQSHGFRTSEPYLLPDLRQAFISS
jgi:hypothetical protein